MNANHLHQAFHNDLKAALLKHKHLARVEMLAVASQFVGSILAMQDQRQMTAKRGMELILGNIEIGNGAAVIAAFGTEGTTKQ